MCSFSPSQSVISICHRVFWFLVGIRQTNVYISVHPYAQRERDPLFVYENFIWFLDLRWFGWKSTTCSPFSLGRKSNFGSLALISNKILNEFWCSVEHVKDVGGDGKNIWWAQRSWRCREKMIQNWIFLIRNSLFSTTCINISTSLADFFMLTSSPFPSGSNFYAQMFRFN